MSKTKSAKLRMIKVAIKRPNEDPYVVPVSAELDAMQKLVGGYLQEVKICNDLIVLCDEEGKLKGQPYNCCLCGLTFVGTLVFAGVKNNDWADLPLSYSEFRTLFSRLYKEN